MREEKNKKPYNLYKTKPKKIKMSKDKGKKSESNN